MFENGPGIQYLKVVPNHFVSNICHQHPSPTSIKPFRKLGWRSWKHWTIAIFSEDTHTSIKQFAISINFFFIFRHLKIEKMEKVSKWNQLRVQSFTQTHLWLNARMIALNRSALRTMISFGDRRWPQSSLFSLQCFLMVLFLLLLCPSFPRR